MKQRGQNWLRLILWVVGVELVGITGGLITTEAIAGWYVFLEKPRFSPPNWVFGPVWTVLYAMIGYVGYKLWSEKGKKTKRERQLFLVQLVLNAIWSPVFFGLKRLDWSLVVISGLWIVLAVLINKLWQKRLKLAVWLVPYWLWVSFAVILNLSIWRLN